MGKRGDGKRAQTRRPVERRRKPDDLRKEDVNQTTYGKTVQTRWFTERKRVPPIEDCGVTDEFERLYLVSSPLSKRTKIGKVCTTSAT